ncbi:MAG: protein-L-isoaspartate(D-aspartate) O-methyltransferase, partial [Planctomycetaceae bacterium]|nr:protein-L-isoaspartate(D-aspartate) O-methyltransferase [Planctomycetaceae bacterium]
MTTLKMIPPKVIIILLLFGLTGMLPGQTVREIRTPEPTTKKKDPWPVIPAAQKMVEEELLPQGSLKNEAVLDAVMRVPRDKFVPPVHKNMAYRDTALPIGNAQTISPPYIVSYMTEKLDPQPDDKVLEIGTGSGYQAAVLSLLVNEVYSIEIVESLGKRAARTLKKIGYKNVFTKVGDGYQGWPDAAPFDKIIVTCSPESVPQPLIDQLKDGGLMIIPIGERYQQHFQLLRKKGTELEKESLTPALFVPMTGEAENNRIVLPDAKNPSIIGGDFEQTTETGHPVGWHYARNATVLEDTQSPSGLKFIRFEIPVEPRFQFPVSSWQPQPGR